jgi:integrase
MASALRPVVVPVASPSFVNISTAWLYSNRRHPSTLRTYAWAIRILAERWPTTGWSTDPRDVIQDIRLNFRPATANLLTSVLVQLGHYCLSVGLIASTKHWYARPLPAPTRRYDLTREQFARLMQVGLTHRGTSGPLPTLLGLTGVRIGEALALTWTDVEVEASQLNIHSYYSVERRNFALPKTRASYRRIPLSASLLQALLRWRRDPDPTAFVFPHRRLPQRPVNIDDVRAELRQLATAVGIQATVTPHTLRHAFATVNLQAGLDVRTISTLLGHSEISVTLTSYCHVTADSIRAVRAHAEQLLEPHQSRAARTDRVPRAKPIKVMTVTPRAARRVHASSGRR